MLRVIPKAILIRSAIALLALFCAVGVPSLSSAQHSAQAPTAPPAPPIEAAPSPTEAAQPNAEWSLLRQGTGAVVVLRHTIAPGTGDPPNFQLGDCSTQRNLSDEGREQARRIGEQFRQQNIPVARVLSSQWCRCLETAELLDLGDVEPFPALNSLPDEGAAEAQQTAQVKALIAEHRNSKEVILLVTHQSNITALTGVVPEQGEALVLQADSQDQIQVAGNLPLGD